MTLVDMHLVFLIEKTCMYINFSTCHDRIKLFYPVKANERQYIYKFSYCPF